MARVLALLLLAGFASSASVSRVIGGSETQIENYPSLAQVEFQVGMVWGQACSASILTTEFVLTAASCFSGVLFSQYNRRVRAGATERSTGGTISNTAIVINHPSYDSSTGGSDISLVRLETPLVYSDTIQQGSIIAQGVTLTQGLPVVTAGWGITSTEGYASQTLQDANLVSITNTACREQYDSNTITDTMICAQSTSGAQRACTGDEGSPLYFSNVIFGVASRTNGLSCDPSLPSVYTSVAQYSDWIVANAV